jgi:hypothetical protein
MHPRHARTSILQDHIDKPAGFLVHRPFPFSLPRPGLWFCVVRLLFQGIIRKSAGPACRMLAQATALDRRPAVARLQCHPDSGSRRAGALAAMPACSPSGPICPDMQRSDFPEQ